jgi:RND family efflux transporter MFP subunit
MLAKLVVLGALCSLSCSRADAYSRRDELPRVETAEVVLVAAVPPSRHVLALQPVRRSRLSPRYGGVISKLEFKAQERVTKGDVLVRFVGSEASARVATTQASLRVAQTELHGKRTEYERTQRLAKSGLVSEQDLEKIASEVQVLRAKVAEASAAIAQAKDLLDATELVAPYDGSVTEYFVQPGDYVEPPAPVLVFCDLEAFYVDVPLTEREAVLHDGKKLTMTTRIRGTKVPAELAWLSRSAGAGADRFVARLHIPDPDGRFRGGESAEVIVHPKREASSLAIPATALRWKQGESFVLRLSSSQDRLERVGIHVLGDFADRVTVEGKLAVGDRVVLGGPSSLAEGSRVEVLFAK